MLEPTKSEVSSVKMNACKNATKISSIYIATDARIDTGTMK